MIKSINDFQIEADKLFQEADIPTGNTFTVEVSKFNELEEWLQLWDKVDANEYIIAGNNFIIKVV
jgi:hypothetical protein